MPYFQREAWVSGRTKRPYGASTFRMRRNTANPQLQEAEAYIIELLAPKGSKGMRHSTLFGMVADYMTQWTFEGITSDGPFEYQGQTIFYLPMSDLDVARRLNYIRMFFPHLHALPNSRNTSRYAYSGPSSHYAPTLRRPHTLKPEWSHPSPGQLFTPDEDSKHPVDISNHTRPGDAWIKREAFPSPPTLKQEWDPSPRPLFARKDFVGKPNQKRSEYVRIKCETPPSPPLQVERNEAFGAICDKIASMLAKNGGTPLRLETITHVLLHEYGIATQEVFKAINYGPFHYSGGEVSCRDYTSNTRSAYYSGAPARRAT